MGSVANLHAIVMWSLALELAETIVGDPDPFLAVGDVLHARRFDAIIIADARKLTRHDSADLFAAVS